MSTLARTIRNLRKVGIKDAWHQMNYIGDTKAGTLMGVDKFGNKYFENKEELPLRTRWIDYKAKDYDPGQIEPGWHAWISYAVDVPPPQDPLMASGKLPWQTDVPKPLPNFTLSRGAYKPYSTTKSKVTQWEPIAAPRR